MVASSNMGARPRQAVSNTSDNTSKFSKNILEHGRQTRTKKKSQVESVCLEDLWRENLMDAGWSQRTATQMSCGLAQSTLQQYNRILTRLKVFCSTTGRIFPPSHEADLVEFLCTISDGSDKPKSQLNCTMAACSKLYKAMELRNLTESDAVKGFVMALVKSQTSQPRTRSSVMPVNAFTSLFKSWPSSDELSHSFA